MASKKQYILTIDAGTTSNRVILFDKDGSICAQQAREFEQIYPQTDWVEHDAFTIWNDVYALIKTALQSATVGLQSIAAIAITNQRETALLWDKESGNPVGNAIVWQDRRGAQICEELINDDYASYIQENTGLVIDAYFSASKVAWMLRQSSRIQADAEHGRLLFGTIDTWLLYQLTGKQAHATDYSNASRTMFYNIKTLAWDQKILQRLQIPEVILPTVHSSSYLFGTTDPDLFDGHRIPIAGMAGDQHAALFGQTCFEPGMAKNTYGTGNFALVNIGNRFRASKHRLLTTIAWGIEQQITYALEGSIFVTGAAIQWLRDGLGIIAHGAESEQLAQSIPSNNGVYFVPAFVGLGAPHWDMYARGMLIGLTRKSGRAEIARAALESIAYQSKEVLDAMAIDADMQLTTLRVDGGAVVNNFLMQFQADLLGIPVSRPQIIESTARGAAFLAGLAVGFWSSLAEIAKTWQEEQQFSPQLSTDHRDRLFKQWLNAVERSKGWKAYDG